MGGYAQRARIAEEAAFVGTDGSAVGARSAEEANDPIRSTDMGLRVRRELERVER